VARLGGWPLTVSSPNDPSGLRKPKNVKFGTKLASSTRMMHANFFEKVVKCGKYKKYANSTRNEHIILRTLLQKLIIVEMYKLAQT